MAAEKCEWIPSDEIIYANGRINPSVSEVDLIEHENWDPRANEGDHLEQAIFAVIDELELLSTVLEAEHHDTEFRIAYRAQNRLHVALEVNRRRRQIELAEAQVFVAPKDESGEPNFDVAEPATVSNMGKCGWVRREDFVKAVESMVAGIATERAEKTAADHEPPESGTIEKATAVP